MEIPRHWRIRKQRYSMVGGVCPSCETKMFPAREVCPTCGFGAPATIQVDDQAIYAQPILVSTLVLNA
jgi:hypothetical protein